MLRHLIYLVIVIPFTTAEILDLTEGSACTWNDANGTCVSIYRCLSAEVLIKQKEHPPVCMYKGFEPIICCTDCELVNDTRKIIIDYSLGILNKTGPKAYDKCLEYLHNVSFPCKELKIFFLSRILDTSRMCYKRNETLEHLLYFSEVGGRSADRDEFPHMALLGYGDNVTSAQWLCGGTVISNYYILTAAHCLSGPDVGNVTFIALGILKRSDPPELWQIFNVAEAIRHPDYLPPAKYHDIALLKTDRLIEFNDNVLPACVNTKDTVEETATATGWGALGHREKLADNLQAVTVEKFEDEECSVAYPVHRLFKRGYDQSIQMCYGSKTEAKDTCQGDSGGPLHSLDKVEYCAQVIIGVTSFGRQCGVPGNSGMYTKVQHYVPWIESIVWPDE